MNFLSGEIDGNGFFRHAAGVVPLNDHAHGRLVLGVRAEDVISTGNGPSLGPVTLEVVEQMGHESLGYFPFAGVRMAMRLPADSGLGPGDTIEPRLRPGAWRLFKDDAEGRRVESS